MSKKCPNGQILRKGYTAKRYGKNVRVPESCIRATSYRGVKRSVEDKKELQKLQKNHEKMAKKYGHARCSPGEEERAGYVRREYKRKAYTRKNGTNVRATHVKSAEAKPVCIKKRGKGTGYKIPTVLEKGDLKKFGYGNVRDLSIRERHKALTNAVESVKNPLSIFRKLIVVSTMNRNTNPEVSDIFHQDAYWLRSKFGLMDSPRKNNTRSGSKSTGVKKVTNKSTGRKKTASKSNRKKINI